MLFCRSFPTIPTTVKRVGGDVCEMPIAVGVRIGYADFSHDEVTSRLVRVGNGVTSTAADPIYTSQRTNIAMDFGNVRRHMGAA